jgi:acyl-CoA reductase-like NAD-dependent aldehyde dehydrogenase
MNQVYLELYGTAPYSFQEILGGAPMTGKLKICIDGEWRESRATRYMDCFDPSTRAVIAEAPQSTAGEVEEAVLSAQAAFPAWADTPAGTRVQVLFRMKALLDRHLDELTLLLARENGKVLNEPLGVFGFTGHKRSFFGDLHAMGSDGVRFFTEQKSVTTTWFADAGDRGAVANSWDGMISMPDDKR